MRDPSSSPSPAGLREALPWAWEQRPFGGRVSSRLSWNKSNRQAPVSPADARQLQDGAMALLDPVLADEPFAAVIPQVNGEAPVDGEAVMVEADVLAGHHAL